MSDGRDRAKVHSLVGKPQGGNRALGTHPVALVVKNSKDLHDGASSRKAGCGPAREVPGGVFLLVFSEICTALA